MPICWRSLSMSALGSVISCALKGDGAGGGDLQQVQAPQEGGLAGAGGADDDHLFARVDVLRQMSSSTRWSPKDLLRFLTSITLTQPPFQLALEPGEDQHQDQVHDSGDDVGVHSLIGTGDDGLGEVDDLLAAD